MQSATKLAGMERGGWRDEYADMIEAHGLAALSIMVRGDDLSFLQGLSLRGLVLNGGEVRDLSPVASLRDLETLTLNTPAKPRMELDFGSFPLLERLRMYWNPGFESVFSCGRLETLWMFSPPDADLTRFGAMPGLKRLELSQGRKLVSTTGVGALDFLGLYQQTALEELRDLPELQVLAIESCKKLGSLDGVPSLAAPAEGRQLRGYRVASAARRAVAVGGVLRLGIDARRRRRSVRAALAAAAARDRHAGPARLHAARCARSRRRCASVRPPARAGPPARARRRGPAR